MKYKEGLEQVIVYLQGKEDIYDGAHNAALNIWDDAWDEMLCMGYNPQTVDGIKRYIREELS